VFELSGSSDEGPAEPIERNRRPLGRFLLLWAR